MRNEMELRDAINLQEAYLNVYAPEDLKEDYEIAAEYFYEQGLNDDGVAILIEELGIDEFTEWVEDILEDYNLTEWRRGVGGTRVRGSGMSKSGKSIEDLKGGAKASAIRATPEHKARAAERKSTSSSSNMRDALRSQSATSAASRQKPTPKSEAPTQTKRGIGHLLRSAGQYVDKRAREDLASVGRSMRTARQAGRQAEAGVQAGAKLIGRAVSGLRNTPQVTRARREVQVTLGRGAQRAGEFGKHAAAAAGAAAGTGVRLHRQGKTARQIASAAGGTFAKHLSDIYREEVEEFVDNLIDEGYDLSNYTWDDMYEMYLDEITKLGLTARKRAEWEGSQRRRSREYRQGFRPPLGKRERGYRNLERRQSSQHADLGTQKMTGDTGSHGGNYHQRMLNRDPKNNPKHTANQKNTAESVDIFDYVLDYLLDEGYTNTVDGALAIMSTMSEDWRDSILEEVLEEGYQTPKFSRDDYLRKLEKRGGMGTGSPGDPMGYRDPKMSKVGAHFVARTTASHIAKKEGIPDSYIAKRKSESKYRKP